MKRRKLKNHFSRLNRRLSKWVWDRRGAHPDRTIIEIAREVYNGKPCSFPLVPPREKQR